MGKKKIFVPKKQLYNLRAHARTPSTHPANGVSAQHRLDMYAATKTDLQITKRIF